MKRGCTSAKPLAGKTLAMIFLKSSTRTRVSFEVGSVPARRPRTVPERPRHPDRPRRTDRRHRARPLAHGRRHHDPHLRPRRHRRARRCADGPRDQRPHRSAASVPGARRPAHRAAAFLGTSTERKSRGSATATTWRTRGSTRRTGWDSSSRWRAPRATTPTPRLLARAQGAPTSRCSATRDRRSPARTS